MWSLIFLHFQFENLVINRCCKSWPFCYACHLVILILALNYKARFKQVK